MFCDELASLRLELGRKRHTKWVIFGFDFVTHSGTASLDVRINQIDRCNRAHFFRRQQLAE